MLPRSTRAKATLVAITAAILLGGCVEQTMTVTTDPPGALVSLNGQELGRTPFQQDFTWYGDYEIEVRRDGYQTIKTHKWVKAPWWNWVPFDLVADVVPWQVRDHQQLHYAMAPTGGATTAPSELMDRAMEMQGQLQSSQYTRMPSTEPTTKPSRRSGSATSKPAR